MQRKVITQHDALARIDSAAARFEKTRDFFLQDALAYYHCLFEHIKKGYTYGFLKEDPADTLLQITSLHSLVKRIQRDELAKLIHKYEECTVTYTKEQSRIVKLIGQNCRATIEEVLSSGIVIYGDSIYYLEKGYKPCFIYERTLTMILSEHTKLFFPE